MPTMNLSTSGVFCFLDTVPGAELSPLVRKVERLGYSVLWQRTQRHGGFFCSGGNP
jgi:hypothetical protein